MVTVGGRNSGSILVWKVLQAPQGAAELPHYCLRCTRVCSSLVSFDSAHTLEQKKRTTDTVCCLAHQRIYGFYSGAELRGGSQGEGII